MPPALDDAGLLLALVGLEPNRAFFTGEMLLDTTAGDLLGLWNRAFFEGEMALEITSFLGDFLGEWRASSDLELTSFLGDFLGECRASSIKDFFFKEQLSLESCFLGDTLLSSSLSGDLRPNRLILTVRAVLGEAMSLRAESLFLGVSATGLTTGLILILIPLLVSRTWTWPRLGSAFSSSNRALLDDPPTELFRPVPWLEARTSRGEGFDGDAPKGILLPALLIGEPPLSITSFRLSSFLLLDRSFLTGKSILLVSFTGAILVEVRATALDNLATSEVSYQPKQMFTTRFPPFASVTLLFKLGLPLLRCNRQPENERVVSRSF